jgi:hypothetical protein
MVFTRSMIFSQIEGNYSTAFRPANGIIQGCPLSMVLLTSLITTCIEYCHSHLPDDLPINAKSRQKKDLIVQTQKMHHPIMCWYEHQSFQMLHVWGPKCGWQHQENSAAQT